MTLMFNAVEFIHRLEKAGLGREAAEAIAQGIEERNARIASQADMEKLELGLRTELGQLESGLRTEMGQLATKQDLEVAIATALARQTIQFGMVTGAATALIIAAVGVIVSIH